MGRLERARLRRPRRKTMVVTMLEARVSADRAAALIDSFGGAGADLPDSIVESFLLHDGSTDLWRVVTVWRSREALEGYRSSVETPEGVRMFRSAGTEPELTIFDVAGHAAHPGSA
jgi:heme-degrading monooxygenase HmoA